MRSVDVLETLELLGSTQWGLVTSAQAGEAGVTRLQLSRLADRGTLQRVRHGVYALPSADSGPLQPVRAAWLSTGGGEPDVVVSGQSAAAVHRLGDLVPAKHEFTSRTRRQTRQPDLHHRKDDLPADHVVTVAGLPVTSVPRTVSDLAHAATDLDHLAAVVRDAFTTPGVTATDLAQALDAQASTYGQNSGHALLASLLDSPGYAPDEGVLQLYSERLQRAALRTLAPRLQEAFDLLLEEHLRDASKRLNPDEVRAFLDRSMV